MADGRREPPAQGHDQSQRCILYRNYSAGHRPRRRRSAVSPADRRRGRTTAEMNIRPRRSPRRLTPYPCTSSSAGRRLRQAPLARRSALVAHPAPLGAQGGVLQGLAVGLLHKPTDLPVSGSYDTHRLLPLRLDSWDRLAFRSFTDCLFHTVCPLCDRGNMPTPGRWHRPGTKLSRRAATRSDQPPAPHRRAATTAPVGRHAGLNAKPGATWREPLRSPLDPGAG